MNCRLRIALAAFLLAASPAFATNIGVTPGSGATIATTIDTNGDNMSHIVVCDRTATNLNCTTVKAGSTAAVAGDTPLVVTMHPSTASVPVTGTFWQATQPVSGTVTSNAGTNLNTSLLALESGGNLATIAGSITAAVEQANEKQINGVAPLMGNGVTGTGSQRVTISSDNTPFTVNTQPAPAVTGGLTFVNAQPTASTNSTLVITGAHQVYHIVATNNSATINYLRLYNSASAPTCSSASNLQAEIAIPASTSGAGFVEDISAGMTFGAGISYCLTGGYATTDVTNATASAINLVIGYK